MNDKPLKILRIYIAKHAGAWLGGHSVILAHDENEAIELLNVELESNSERKFDKEQDKITEITESSPTVITVFNGDY